MVSMKPPCPQKLLSDRIIYCKDSVGLNKSSLSSHNDNNSLTIFENKVSNPLREHVDGGLWLSRGKKRNTR